MINTGIGTVLEKYQKISSSYRTVLKLGKIQTMLKAMGTLPELREKSQWLAKQS